jgi:hypothetical protein
MNTQRALATILLTLVSLHVARAQTAIVSGEGPRRAACRAAIAAVGDEFPAGARARGITCADGAPCDRDGVVNGVCQLAVQVCVNTPDPACPASQVQSVRVKARGRQGRDADVRSLVDALQAAAAAILPTGEGRCSASVDLPVRVSGPDRRGRVDVGRLDLAFRARPRARGTAGLVCRPSSEGPATTTTTSSIGTTTTTTLVAGPVGEPGDGLRAEITSAMVGAGGVVTATFRLTDDAGVPVRAVTGTTTNPDEARVRFTIARLDVESPTQEGLTTTFTRYRNYITVPQTSPITGQTSRLPGYDSGGTLAVADLAAGVWTYTFRTMLPAGFDPMLTHTIGGQVERSAGGTTWVANPVFDFVPAGGAVASVREVVTTAQCNGCHNPLAEHGGGRREVKLCQLCHTDQGVDPDTGSSIDFLQMIHRIHQGRDLPSIVNGAIGTKFEIIGFRQTRFTYGEKVAACAGGAFNGIPCVVDADCGSAGTCTGSITTGVAFPRDIRRCDSCHAAGATAANWRERPSAAACASCHDDINPGQTPTPAGAPGTGHTAGAQPDVLCRVCHTPTGAEFGLSVEGGHTVSLRSTTLAGLQAEILAATGTPGAAIEVQFRLSDGLGTPLTSLGSLSRVAFAASGPSTDFGGASDDPTEPAALIATAAGSGASGTLTGPDGSGVFTYTFPGTALLPADATGTWRVGIEARRGVTVDGESVNEAARNVVRDFSVDGSPVVARSQVVAQEKCAACHGTFSVDFGVHGNLRNEVAYCVICHNARTTDVARRASQIAAGASASTETIHMKVLTHKLHTGEELDQRLYVVYGFGSRPVDLGEVRFPGDRRDCATCHVNGSQLLPLRAGLLPTRLTEIVGGVETVVEERPPVTAACITCHDSEAALAHARINTLGTVEACHVCHGEGRLLPISEAHATQP